MTTINNTSFAEVVMVVMEDTHPADVMDIDCSSQPHDYFESQEYNEPDDMVDCPVCRNTGCTDDMCVEVIEKAEYMAQFWADF